MSERVSPIPPGIHTITPHIVVPDAAAGAQWYSRALGAQERSRITLPDGRAMTLELRLGDSAVMVASEFPDIGVLSPLSIGGTATVLQIYSEDVASLWKRALDAGARELHALGETFWGDLHGQLADPFGHRWNLAERIREVSADELARGAAAAFGG